MRSRNLPARLLVVAVGLLSLVNVASAGTEQVLHTFSITDGEFPYDGVIFDGAGNLYGTTFYGGSTACGGAGCGAVFKLAPNESGWTESTVYAFTGLADGSHPYSPLIFDAAGNLYGTTYGAYDGGTGFGTVFRLTPGANGAWSFAVLYTFAGGNDGAQPSGSLAFDPGGNLYGVTFSGGLYNTGIAYELSPTTAGEWNEAVLHAFTGHADGGQPAGLVSNGRGDIYGATFYGGEPGCILTGCGVVFALSPTTGGRRKETILYTFTGGNDGGVPRGLILDASGHLYGAAIYGGTSTRCDLGCRLVFELAADSNNVWKETVLHNFNRGDGEAPGAVGFNDKGRLYGTTPLGVMGLGAVFEIAPDVPTVVFGFDGTGGYQPLGPIAFDQAGNIYGATVKGGANGVGLVYEVMP